MPIGTISFPNGAKYSFNRSYLAQIIISRCGPHNLIHNDNEFIIDITVPFPHFYVIRFEEKVYEWSSNTYTMDFCLTDVYYVIPPSPTQNPANGVLRITAGINISRWALRFDIAGCTDDPIPFALQGNPADWWSGNN